MSYSIAILSRDADAYVAALQHKLAPEFTLTQVATTAKQLDPAKIQILLADPNLAVQVLPMCQQLLWYQSTWAGNTPVIRLAKRDYILTGVKGIFDAAMREYVFAYLLYFSRNVEGFAQQQTVCENRWQKPPFSSLNGQTLALLGAGSIAQAILPVAKMFGMRVVGLSRSGQTQTGYAKVYNPAEWRTFAQQAQYLVNLLPHTASTEGFIGADFLAAMPAQSILINAGRGHSLDDDALLEALQRGHLRAAVLDVFRQEPLPDTHPFWQHPRVYITQHTAAISLPADVASIFLQNADLFAQGKGLRYCIDFDLGY